MAEASPLLLTVTPKLLGKHLRDVRRKKGLSQSEVARGAGLSRRELVAYERGKVPIPESDLWVLAGSCGVDVSELLPTTSTPELAAASTTTIGDTVAQLRRNQEDIGLAPYLATLNRLRALPPGKRVPVKDRELDAMAEALGRDPATIEARLQSGMHVSPEEAARLRALILPPTRSGAKPRALEAAATIPAPPVMATVPGPPPPFFDTPIDAATGNVDVFEELARLPEPLPLGDPATPVPDFLTSPLPPNGAVELVDGMPQPVNASVGFGAAAFGNGAYATGEAPAPEPVLVDSAIAAWNAADAPPIDVAQRQGSSTWDWGAPPAPPLEQRPVNGDMWEATPWQPPAPGGAGMDAPPTFWEGTDDWTPSEWAPAPPEAAVATPETDVWAPTDWEADHWGSDQWGTSPSTSDQSTPDQWTSDQSTTSTTDEWASDQSTSDQWASDELDSVQWNAPVDASGPVDDAGTPDPGAPDAGPWDHQPDPEAVSTGFYVDWGAPESDAEPPAWESLVGADTSDVVFDTVDTAAVAALGDDWAPEAPEATDALVEDDALPPIMWRADAVTPLALGAAETTATPEFTPSPEPLPLEFVVAGSDWQLGNALPLVEVRGQGALVMRRADERWALADVATPTDFVLEVDVDFRSGPGLGVLFRASVDGEGRMSGYSFDIDPIYDGGGYLVRQWQADRELWNPIARVASGDPTTMHGSLTVRLVVTDDHLVALVNGVEVLTVESLKQASTDRGREAATGDRVGVQAWSSSDLVIDTLRVASA